MKKLMKGAVLGTLASVLLLSGCSNEQAAPANEEKRVCTVDNGGVEGLDMTVTRPAMTKSSIRSKWTFP